MRTVSSSDSSYPIDPWGANTTSKQYRTQLLLNTRDFKKETRTTCRLAGLLTPDARMHTREHDAKSDRRPDQGRWAWVFARARNHAVACPHPDQAPSWCVQVVKGSFHNCSCGEREAMQLQQNRAHLGHFNPKHLGGSHTCSSGDPRAKLTKQPRIQVVVPASRRASAQGARNGLESPSRARC